MSDFEAALQKSLAERTAFVTKFAEADKDLHQICADAGRGVRNQTGGLATLKLVEISPGWAERAYTLDFVTEDEHRILRVYALDRAGYPIHAFASLEQFNAVDPKSGISVYCQLADRSALERAIRDLAGPDSELVLLVEFVLRNREQFGSGTEKGM